MPGLDATSPVPRLGQAETPPGLCLFEDARGAAPRLLLRDPEAVLTSKDGRGVVRWSDGREQAADGDPFLLLRDLLRESDGLTAAGYWGYDLRYHLERLPRIARDDLALPDCHVGLYRRAEGGTDCGRGFDPPLPGAVPPGGTQGPAGGALRSSLSPEEYRGAVRRVLDYIAAGDCYQVNLSQRFDAPLRGSAWELYNRLRRRSPAPRAAYLDAGTHQVLSASPELFLRVRGREVETRPIKGTRPRGAHPEEDAALAAELLASAKDRAELLMIVDLERNDLGRVCEYGTVHVPELHRLESYAQVHHLVAAVRGRLRPEVHALECLRALFPGGSITGAPKIRAMEIIEEVEPVRRGIYTGAIGWVDGRGDGEWSIAIRTMVVRDGRVYFHAGGGIVADSDPELEFQESLAKARGMLAAL